ncbi:MAG: VWA domain-containing protein [Chitinophagales bacterium]
MKKQLLYRSTIIIALLFAVTQQSIAQSKTTRILFLVDASRSMLQNWDRNSKMFAGVKVVNGIADSLNDMADVQMAMRVYGHQSPQPANDCEDTKLEITFKAKNALAIKNRLDDIRPQGVTPIAYSIEQTLSDFGKDAANYRNILILVSDGFESCGLNPCEVVLRLKNQGIITKSYVIGIGIDATEYSQFSCMGEFLNIESENKTDFVINTTIAKLFNSVFTRVDLLDVNDEAKETDVLMTFYDTESGKPKFSYYHTINPKGNPDTITLDPALIYDVQVHTTPPVWKKDVLLNPGKLNIITEPSPQGYLKVYVRGETFKGKINCIVKQDKSIITNQTSNNSQKLLVGRYDLEILTLPVIKVSGVEVEQDQTTTIEISAPGYVTFLKNEPIAGGIYEYRENKLIEIFELNDANLKETLAIQPGKYKVIYRYLSKKDMAATREVEFEVVTGTSLNVRL